MKTIYNLRNTLRLAMIFVAVAVAQGCDSDSSPKNPGIDGMWSLTNVSGTISGTSDDFEPGLITWDFNTATHKVTVVNNNTDADSQDVLPSGTYDYSVEPSDLNLDCDEDLIVDIVNLGCFSVGTTEMTTIQHGADGIDTTFRRSL